MTRDQSDWNGLDKIKFQIELRSLPKLCGLRFKKLVGVKSQTQFGDLR